MYYNCYAETKYNTDHIAIMTTLYGCTRDNVKTVLIACSGWRNTDDMIRLYHAN